MVDELSAVAVESIKGNMLLVVEGDSAKAYRYGMKEYANAVAASDANEGQRVAYMKLPSRIQVVPPTLTRESDPNEESDRVSGVINLGTIPHDIYLKGE